MNINKNKMEIAADVLVFTGTSYTLTYLPSVEKPTISDFASFIFSTVLVNGFDNLHGKLGITKNFILIEKSAIAALSFIFSSSYDYFFSDSIVKSIIGNLVRNGAFLPVTVGVDELIKKN